MPEALRITSKVFYDLRQVIDDMLQTTISEMMETKTSEGKVNVKIGVGLIRDKKLNEETGEVEDVWNPIFEGAVTGTIPRRISEKTPESKLGKYTATADRDGHIYIIDNESEQIGMDLDGEKVENDKL